VYIHKGEILVQVATLLISQPNNQNQSIAFRSSVRERHSEESGRLGLMRRRRWRSWENKCMCKYLTIFGHQLLKKDEDGAKLEQDEQTKSVTHRRHSTSIRMVEYFWYCQETILRKK